MAGRLVRQRPHRRQQSRRNPRPGDEIIRNVPPAVSRGRPRSRACRSSHRRAFCSARRALPAPPPRFMRAAEKGTRGHTPWPAGNRFAPPFSSPAAASAGWRRPMRWRGKGFPVRVLEQAPEFREVGAGIQLGPNIFRALEKIGLKDAVLADAHRPPAHGNARRAHRRAASPASRSATSFAQAFRPALRGDPPRRHPRRVPQGLPEQQPDHAGDQPHASTATRSTATTSPSRSTTASASTAAR